MGNRFYLRTAEVLFGIIGQPAATKVSVRIKFAVEKCSSYHASTVLASLYNLNSNSRGLIQRPNGFIIINAGYDGEMNLIGTGKIWSARPVREGPDIVMVIEASDVALGSERGFLDVSKAPISVNIGPGGTNQQILQSCLNVFKVNKIPIGLLEPLPISTYYMGFAYGGEVGVLLNQLLENFNMFWKILDGQFRIFSFGPIRPEPPILLTPDTGLIEIPSQETPIIIGGRPLFKAKSLLNAELNIDRKVNIQGSKFLNGVYDIFSVLHQGDTEEGDYATNLEVR